MRIFACRIPASINTVGSIVEEIVNSLQDSYGDIHECVLFDIKVILNELMLNAVKHGSKCDCSKLVKISADIIDGHYAAVLIRDEGPGFDYNCLEDCCMIGDGDFQDFRETGRGIKIVKNLCSKMKFNQKGNSVVVLKDLLYN